MKPVIKRWKRCGWSCGYKNDPLYEVVAFTIEGAYKLWRAVKFGEGSAR